MSERYWHEFCFTGPQNAEPLVEAANAAGFKFEFGGSEPDESFVGLGVQLDAAQRRIAALAGEAPSVQLTIELDDPPEKVQEALHAAMDALSRAGYRPYHGHGRAPGGQNAIRIDDYV